MRMEKVYYIDTFEADTTSDEVSIKSIEDGKLLIKHIDRVFICNLNELKEVLDTIEVEE